MSRNDKRWKQEWSLAALGKFVLLTPSPNILALEIQPNCRELLSRHFTQGYLDMDKIP